MAKKTEATAIAVRPTPIVAEQAVDLMKGIAADEFDDDGLGQVSSEDYKLPALIFNFKGVGKDGRKIPEDVFFNTVTEEVKEKVHLAVLKLYKTNMYSVYSNEKKKNEAICSSRDRITGTMMATGKTRGCKGCPDAKWKMGNNGKTVRNCGPVYNLIAIDRESGMPAVLRCKRTSLNPAKSYLQKHFIGRRLVENFSEDGSSISKTLTNYPLFAFETIVTLTMSDNGNYAIPVFENGGVLDLEEMRQHSSTLAALNQNLSSILDIADSAEEQEGDAAAESSEDNARSGQSYVSAEGQDMKE